jgi:predicted enzyme related to lactoylglutathione lyase
MSNGTFVWHDLMTTDADRARGFYGELFGWRFEPLAMGPLSAWLITADGAPLGTIMPEASLPSSHWMPYLGVDDVDAACARVKQLGGHVCMAAMDVPPLGRFAIAGDPQGGWFSLLRRPDGAPPPPPPATGRFAFDELGTSDAQAAATFYAVLFGWTFATRGDNGATYREVRHGDRAIGGVCAQSLFARPAWMPSVAVDDLDGASLRATRLGGTAVTRGVIADPTGATIGLRATAR